MVYRDLYDHVLDKYCPFVWTRHYHGKKSYKNKLIILWHLQIKILLDTNENFQSFQQIRVHSKLFSIFRIQYLRKIFKKMLLEFNFLLKLWLKLLEFLLKMWKIQYKILKKYFFLKGRDNICPKHNCWRIILIKLIVHTSICYNPNS